MADQVIAQKNAAGVLPAPDGGKASLPAPIKRDPNLERDMDKIMSTVGAKVNAIYDQQAKDLAKGKRYTDQEVVEKIEQVVDLFYKAAKGTAVEKFLPNRSEDTIANLTYASAVCKNKGYLFRADIVGTRSTGQMANFRAAKINSVESVDPTTIDTAGIPLPEKDKITIHHLGKVWAQPFLGRKDRALGFTTLDKPRPLITLHDDEIKGSAKENGVPEADMYERVKFNELGNYIFMRGMHKIALANPDIKFPEQTSFGRQLTQSALNESYSDLITVRNVDKPRVLAGQINAALTETSTNYWQSGKLAEMSVADAATQVIIPQSVQNRLESEKSIRALADYLASDTNAYKVFRSSFIRTYEREILPQIDQLLKSK